jgi:uncharacterized membrane protein HdeD (DUF308 family)
MMPSPIRSLAEQRPEVFAELRRNAGWHIALGVLMGLLGIVALLLVPLATLVTIKVIGWILLFGGVIEAAQAFTARRWRGFFLHLLIGVFHIVLGGLILAKPAEAADVFTLFIGFFLLFNGVVRLVYAVLPNQFNRLPLAVGGIVEALMGFIILEQWPISGVWVIGLFVGIELIIHGSWLITLGLIVRELPEKLPGGEERTGHVAPG